MEWSPIALVSQNFRMPAVRIGAGHLFDAYYRVMDVEQPEGWDPRRAVEGTKRLKQIDWLLLEVQRREVDVVGGFLPLGDPKGHELMDEIILLTEAFYYFAWRTLEVLARLPNLKAFDPVGVRDVRHRLIEHPERKAVSSALDGRWGLIEDLYLTSGSTKTLRTGGTKVFNTNAIEFREKLWPLLTPFLRRDAELRGLT